MEELLSRISPGDLAGLLYVLISVTLVSVVGIVSVVVTAWRKYHRDQLATSITLEMLDRGCAPEEVVQVLQAAGMDAREERIHGLRQKIHAIRQKAG